MIEDKYDSCLLKIRLKTSPKHGCKRSISEKIFAPFSIPLWLPLLQSSINGAYSREAYSEAEWVARLVDTACYDQAVQSAVVREMVQPGLTCAETQTAPG